MYPMYSARLAVTDINGKVWSEREGFPGTVYFPTYRWHELGEYYRDAWSLNLPADAPAGLYQLDLYWYEYNLETRLSNIEKEYHAALGTVRLGAFAGTPANTMNARFGEAITFTGWSAPTSIARGQSLDVDLFWRADRALNESYTVFVHLLDANGQVVADADSPPFSGLFPTNRWSVGEIVRDRHTLKIPNVPPGEYAIEIGMYLPATGARLPIDNGVDHLVLTQVSVR
jgi:hypothetical protein